MRPLYLHIQNFNTHKDTQIDFTQLGSPLLIKGVNKDVNESNGAGKSSIFNAIYVALFERTTDYVTLGETTSKVEFHFEHEGLTYAVIKEWKDGDCEVALFKEGTLITQSKTEFDNVIQSIIKVSKEVFSQTIFQSQGFLNFFSYMTPKLKTGFISELLNMKQWEDYYKVALKLQAQLDEAISSTNIAYGVVSAQLDQAKTDLTKYDEEDTKKKLSMKSLALSEKEELLKQFAQADQMKIRHSRLDGKIKELSGTISSNEKLYASLYSSLSQMMCTKIMLDTKKVVGVDETYKTQILSSAMAVEKDMAAVEQERRVRRDQFEQQKKKWEAILSSKSCPFCLRPIDDKYHTDVQITLEHEKTQALKVIEDLGTKLTNLTDMKHDYQEQINELSQQALVYQQHIAQLKDTDTKINEARYKLQNISLTIQNTKAEYSSVYTEYTALTQSLAALNTAHVDAVKRDIESIKWDINTLEGVLGTIKGLRSQIVNLEKEKAAKILELDGYNKKLLVVKHTSHILSPNGVQKWLFLKTLDEVAAFANTLLKPVKCSVEFALEQQKKKGEGFKPAFDIEVNTLKGKFNIKRLSGGEGSFVNFVLRLAFSTILATTYGFRFLIIDEGFDYIDGKNREIAVGILASLAQQFQVFLVTHLKDFETHFTNYLIVERSEGVSRVVY